MRLYLDKQNVGSGLGEGNGDGLPDTASSSRDEGGVALEREHVGEAVIWSHDWRDNELLISGVSEVFAKDR